MSLWLPILLASVVVFILSSLIHTVLQYHNRDFAQLPAEDAVMDAIRNAGVEPGDYAFPRPANHREMKTPEFVEKLTRGPVGFMTIMRSGPPSMGGSLSQWFVYLIVVSIFAAYITGRALGPGAEYLHVFRFAGAASFMGYALAHAQGSIWFGRRWRVTLLSMFDGLIYALFTAGVFGWLWPA